MLERLRTKLLNLARATGMDRAVAFTVAQRIWMLASAPITLLLVARGLSPTEQGYYYAFASVLGLQILFELGLIAVVIQFASHEMVSLRWGESALLEGDERALGRLASLLRGASLWYAAAAALTLAVVLPGGAWMFSRRTGTGVSWAVPWLWVVAVSAGRLVISPVFALIEGCGRVAPVAGLRTTSNIVGTLLMWAALLANWRLYAVPINATVQLVGAVYWLVANHRSTLRQLIASESRALSRIDWRKEVWPMQWRIAVSMVSSYFIYQLFVPVLFAVRGPIEAGQMGMSAAIVNTLTVTGLAWVTTKAPQMGAFIARRDFVALDALFFRAFKQSGVVVVLAGSAFWALALGLHVAGLGLAQRVLPSLPLGLLVLSGFANHVFGSQSAYLRAHRQEPFVRIAAAMAVLCSAAAYVLAAKWGATGMMAGFLAIMLGVGVGGGTHIFQAKRREWHAVAK
jgi:hypothetical protein